MAGGRFLNVRRS